MAGFETVRPIPSQPFTIYSPNYYGESFPGESVTPIFVVPAAPPTSVGLSSVVCTLDVFMGERLQIEKFRELVERWTSETRFVSALSEIEQHDALQRIIGMGKSVIPLILQELDRNPSWLLMALDALVDNPPDLDECSQGGVLESTQAWIEWGKRHITPTPSYGYGSFALAV